MDFAPLAITLKIAFLATIVTVILGIPIAWLVVSRLKTAKGLVDGLLTLPMVLPPTVVGFLILLVIGKNGLIGIILKGIDINLTFTWIAGVIASVIVSLPLMYRTARGAFESIDQNLIHVGQTLGMSSVAIFFKVVLPNSIPSILAGVILSFARALGEFGATIMVAGNIPGRTQTMAIAVYSAVQSGDRNTAYFWVVIILGISLVSMLLMNWLASKA